MEKIEIERREFKDELTHVITLTVKDHPHTKAEVFPEIMYADLPPIRTMMMLGDIQRRIALYEAVCQELIPYMEKFIKDRQAKDRGMNQEVQSHVFRVDHDHLDDPSATLG